MNIRNNKRLNYSYEWVLIHSGERNESLIEISKALDLPEFIVKILFERGYKTTQTISDFLKPSLSQLHQPNLLPDMEKSVVRIIQAIEKKEPILIYGDYDTDGATATALLLRVLRKIGAKASFYIPHRVYEGYGLSETGVLYAKSKGFNLIITVDCGSTDFVEIELARKLSIDVIVCDHHETKEILPAAYSVINPKRYDSNYPFNDLGGVGVAFKLAWALLAALNQPKEYLIEHLDIVALGIIADIVPLVDENRILAKFGLDEISKTKKVGLQALLQVAGIARKEITPYEIGFMLAPRINAAGRLSQAEKAVTLLTTDDKQEAVLIAEKLNHENTQRQIIETDILDDAIKQIDASGIAQNKIMVLGDEKWHEGVVGIVATRLVERYYRPTIMLSLKEDKAKGSGRSISGFNIYNALTYCKDYLLGFGGHKYACGVVIAKNKIELFSKKMQEYAETHLPQESLQRKLYIDALLSFNQITDNTLEIIRQFEPFGQGNQLPIFATNGLEVVGYPRVVGRDHLKFKLRANKDKVFEAIAYGRSSEILNLEKGKDDHIDIAYTFDEHTFAGKTKLQLVIKDLRIK